MVNDGAANSGWRGIGWDFPVALTPEGTIQLSQDGPHTVSNSIWTILSTAPGERVMRPDFGCGVGEHVFDLTTSTTTASIVDTVTQALARWEPRIEVLSIQAAPDPDDPARLLIVIDYLLRSSNSRFNLVYPFYVE